MKEFWNFQPKNSITKNWKIGLPKDTWITILIFNDKYNRLSIQIYLEIWQKLKIKKFKFRTHLFYKYKNLSKDSQIDNYIKMQ